MLIWYTSKQTQSLVITITMQNTRLYWITVYWLNFKYLNLMNRTDIDVTTTLSSSLHIVTITTILHFYNSCASDVEASMCSLKQYLKWSSVPAFYSIKRKYIRFQSFKDGCNCNRSNSSDNISSGHNTMFG